MYLLQFLEYSIADFTLWPTYILELLLLKDWCPDNMVKIAAFFYGHKIPLSIASKVYTYCNARGHLAPFILGAYYSTWQNNEGLHVAKYYNVPEGKIFWINGKNHSQTEIVEFNPLEDNMDCRTMNHSQIPSLHAQALLSKQLMNDDVAFDLMD